MTEYFYVARSNAAPFFSDTWEGYVEAESPDSAIQKLLSENDHPAGMFALALWKSADDMHKKEESIAHWHSERAAKQLGG